MSAPHKSARVSAQVELPPGEERIWAMIGTLGADASWTIGDLIAFSGCDRTNVRRYVDRLVLGGFVKRFDEPRRDTKRPAALFQLARPHLGAPRLEADGTPRPEMLIETLWRTIRMLKTFTVDELAGYVAKEEIPAKLGSVRVYVWALCSVGILARDGTPGSARWQRYRLVKTVGPRAPQILSARMVFDPNSGAPLGTATSQEVSL